MVNEIKKFDLESMFKGWFIGNFEPSLFKTNDVEVGIKNTDRVIMKVIIIIK